ncbi:MAG TPA: DUF4190 domain-containing protein [Myxococcales bacterium]|nr:DUF4190 domain-containing protein [Myxococcales bacterium]
MNPNPQYPGQPVSAPPPLGTSGLAIAAFIVGILGLCSICPGLVAIGLAIGALVKIGNTPGLGGKGLAIAGIVLPLVGIPIQLAIAVPNFIKFQSRAKQSECKSNLTSAYLAERSYFAEKQTYTPNIAEIGFSPERGNRYAYFFFDVGQVEDRSTATPATTPGAVGVGVDTFKHKDARPLAFGDLPSLAGEVRPGVHGQCPECSFVVVCAGNVDSDATLDVWSISSEDRTGARGETVPAGMPHNDVNDTTD